MYIFTCSQDFPSIIEDHFLCKKNRLGLFPVTFLNSKEVNLRLRQLLWERADFESTYSNSLQVQRSFTIADRNSLTLLSSEPRKTALLVVSLYLKLQE